MTRSLWTAFEIAEAVDGRVEGAFDANGVCFDSREVTSGDLFVALKGEATDGHRFIAKAFEQGAAGAITSEAVPFPHVRVGDTMAALEALGRAARARTGARIVGVTGSVGKTGTKEALFAAFERLAPGRAHRSVKSYNNHTGVPLSLARMPADTHYAALEMGMNHAGEIAALTRMVRPHVAVITAIAPAHIENFSGIEGIVDAKAEIFEGLEPGGTAVIPFDSPHRDRLIASARRCAAEIVTFGREVGADVRVRTERRVASGGTALEVVMPGAELGFTLAQPGAHWVSNALAVLAAVAAAGGDAVMAAAALSEMVGLPGRGARFDASVPGGSVRVIDESYNANPASMAATIAELGREPAGRKVAILGAMRELGAGSLRYHAELADPLRAAGVEALILVGDDMAPLADALARDIPLQHFPDAASARAAVAATLRPGDALLVKGSNAIGLGAIVADLAAGRYADNGTTPCSI